MRNRTLSLILDHTPHEGVFKTRIPGLYVSRFTQPSASHVKTFYMPSLAMAVQGEKAIAMGRETFPFGASQMFAFHVAMYMPTLKREPFGLTSQGLMQVRIAGRRWRRSPGGWQRNSACCGCCKPAWCLQPWDWERPDSVRVCPCWF
ncbi:AraC family transcriptional regulator N-terminal domain-containing protein [Thermobacillus composti]|uniref:AraC family transcriptional regulator N-terminal domain-containing protein n=1 Tax=Thermobacillus composti TaxID=377615 RepID=UPI0002E61471|nr:AraC family transcriptional regulator N-terminal domain-containing protein [Thermobacillus composti]